MAQEAAGRQMAKSRQQESFNVSINATANDITLDDTDGAPACDCEFEFNVNVNFFELPHYTYISIEKAECRSTTPDIECTGMRYASFIALPESSDDAIIGFNVTNLEVFEGSVLKDLLGVEVIQEEENPTDDMCVCV